MIKSIKLLALAALLFIAGCSEEITDNPVGNKPPETHLYIYSDSPISQQQSRLTVNWWGDDPDGLVVGYYFKWTGDDSWTFTTRNDSLFALRIGASDTNYVFSVMAADNHGNRKYDESLVRNDIELGPEPFTDVNNNGKWDEGEPFTDIGAVDPTPAEQKYPIKNSPPVVTWNEQTVLPEFSFPVMTLRWEIDDVDGIETVNKVYIALNDTNNFVELDGAIRIVTIRTDDFESDSPLMDIYINANPGNVAPEKLEGLRYGEGNRIYVQAEDISGARSEIITLPDTSLTWTVKRPKGGILLIDDFRETFTNDPNPFYIEKFDSVAPGKYDILDIRNANLPFENITFLETIKLFDALYWYSNNPNLDLASTTIQDYFSTGGKAAFSILLPDVVDEELLKSFLPIDSLNYIGFVGSGDSIKAVTEGYPSLGISRTNPNTRTFSVSSVSAFEVYRLFTENNDEYTDEGVIAFETNDRDMFYLGMALHTLDAKEGNAVELLKKVFYEDFELEL